MFFFTSVPSQSPTSVTATVLDSTGVSVHWGPVSQIDQNGIITHYEVEYTSSISTAVSNTTTLMSLSINGLEEYIEYTLRVRAFTSMGAGPFSQPVTVTTLQDGL